MERNCNEVAGTHESILEAAEAPFCELSDLQLTFVGGGMADVVLH